MRSRAFAQTLVTVALTVGGCRFDAPSFEGTSYACEAPDDTCPAGFSCVEGRCVTGGHGGGDGDVVDGPAAAIDAGIDTAPAGTEMRRIEIAFDTTIRSEDPTTNDGAIDLSIDASPRHVALVQLDLTSLPPGTVVLGAILHVTVFDPIETGTYQLYPLTEAWGESTATFEERQPGVPWSNEGISVPTLDANTRLGEFAPRTNGPTILGFNTLAIEGWIDAPATNHGFAIVSTSPDGRGGQIRSRETSVVANRPYMILTIAAP
jgi:hypothetical protein